MRTYPAPWGRSLVIISTISTAFLIGLAISAIASGGPLLRFAVIPLVVVFGAALFIIRGYTVAGNAVLIHRLFWATRLPLADLKSAHFDPDATRRSIRLFGNGGLFSFTGIFRNSRLGTYRAFVTDPRQAIVLQFPKRTVVISPSTPEEFVNEIGTGGSASPPGAP